MNSEERERLRAHFIEKIQRFRYMDDTFMTLALSDKETAKVVLEAILERPVQIHSIETQYSETKLYGRGVRLDMILVDENGVFFNVEVQRADAGADLRRARYNASVLDTVITQPGDAYRALPDTYVIFITEHDFFHKGLQMYHIQRTLQETYEPCEDGQHIIYVNSSCQPDTPLGRMMHDFYCQDPQQMYTPQLAGRMTYLKTDGMEESTMCKIMEEVREEAREELREEIREEVSEKVREETQMQMLSYIIKSGRYGLEEVAEMSGLPLEEVRRLVQKPSRG